MCTSKPVALFAIALLQASCAPVAESGSQPPPASDPGAGPGPGTDAPCPACAQPPRDETQLELRFLGVGGFLIRRGADAIMTAPLYSNPSLTDTTIGSVGANQALVDQFTTGLPLSDVRAILVGHAHYDHLMDVSAVIDKVAPDARVYGNTTMKHLLAAFAPDRGPQCDSPPQAVSIPRERVVAFDDPGFDVVDRRVCPADVGLGGAGAWVEVPGTNVRIRALCSEHPAQFIGYHFGLGSVDADVCDPPKVAGDWKEGLTLAYLIDFMDKGKPAYRIYYQDAPTNAPIGNVPPDVLAEKRVDVALLCVGNFDQVADQPGEILRAMQPRYSIGGHWEDFFQDQSKPIVPLPFQNLDDYRQRQDAAMGTGGETPIVANGTPTSERAFVPNPGTTFVVTRQQP